MTKLIKIYDSGAERFFKEYESISADDIHSDWAKLIPNLAGTALDIGAGSGRDAAYLVDLGFEVFAVEPSDRLRELARQSHTSEKIHWINDRLPNLEAVGDLNIKFDLILLSAVWMHIPSYQRAKTFKSIANILKPNGLLTISLRHGSSPDERVMYDVSTDEVLSFAKKHSLGLVRCSHDTDKLNREDVWWETLCFRNID